MGLLEDINGEASRRVWVELGFMRSALRTHHSATMRDWVLEYDCALRVRGLKVIFAVPEDV